MTDQETITVEKIVCSSQFPRGAWRTMRGHTGSTGDSQEAEGSGNCEQEPLLCFPQKKQARQVNKLKVI